MAVPTRSRSKQEVLEALSGVITVSPSPEKTRVPAGQDYLSSASYSGQSPMTTYEATPSVPTKDPFDPLGPGSRNRVKEQPAPPPASKGGLGSKFGNAFKRQTTEEKEAKRREKEKRMHKAIDDSTMKSSRMDIIDRMDLSGIHGNSLFHHDSPYDACSPHSNRNSRRAPVMAFDHTIDPMTGQPIGMRATNSNRPNLSPLAAATMRKMDDSVGEFNDDSKRSGQQRGNFNAPIPTLRMDSSSTTSTNMLSPSEDAVSTTSHTTSERDAEGEQAYRNRNYYNMPSNVSKGKSDVSNPNADIWGVSSEPWQDFASPAGGASSGLRPRDSRGTGRLSGDSGSGSASAASSVFDMEAVMTGKKPTTSSRRSEVSPSQSDRLAVDAGPKRSKSLIKKIRTARQNPNVPPQDDELELGNLSLNGDTGRARASSGSAGSRRPGHAHSPSSPPLTQRNVSSPNMRSDGSLGRNGTLRAGQGDGTYYRKNASPPAAEIGNQSSGLGRNGSIFGRLLNGKNRERGEVTAR